MFTANTNSGKSLLVWDKELKKPRNSKKGSQSNLEEAKITQMRRSSETQQQLKDTLLKIDTPNFSIDNSQYTSPSRINISPEEQIKLALQTLQLYDINQRSK